jgi:dynein light chain roadblock-type
VPSTSASTSLLLPQATSTSTTTTPSSLPTPELEQTLALLSSHRSVLGYLVLSRGQPVSIIRHSGVVFEGEHGRKYAFAIGKITEGVQSALEEVSGEVNEGVRVLSPFIPPPTAPLTRVISRTKFGSCVSEPSAMRS